LAAIGAGNRENAAIGFHNAKSPRDSLVIDFAQAVLFQFFDFFNGMAQRRFNRLCGIRSLATAALELTGFGFC